MHSERCENGEEKNVNLRKIYQKSNHGNHRKSYQKDSGKEMKSKTCFNAHSTKQLNFHSEHCYPTFLPQNKAFNKPIKALLNWEVQNTMLYKINDKKTNMYMYTFCSFSGFLG